MVQSCFATGIRGLVRPTLGKEGGSRGKGGTVLLISCDVSSLVIDTLCEQAAGGNVAVAYFYFDFAARKEQSPAAILGSVLKQIVSGLDELPERIIKALLNQKKLVLSEIVELLQDISSSRGTFICIDALDECQEIDRVKLLDSLNEILQRSPGVRIFLTGRPHIWDEVERNLPRRVATRPIAPAKDDIALYIEKKLEADAAPNLMDGSLREGIIEAIPETISET